MGRDKMVYMAVKSEPKEEEDDDEDSEDDDDNEISRFLLSSNFMVFFHFSIFVLCDLIKNKRAMSCVSLEPSSDDVCAGNTINQVKNGASTPFLQIREGLGANRVLKPRPKKRKKGDTRQCQTGEKNTTSCL